MIKFFRRDRNLSFDEINYLIDLDQSGIFRTRSPYWDNYVLHFKRLIKALQIWTFRDDGRLIGFCSWVIVDDETKHDINKTTWALPDELNSGDIFYVDVCILTKGTNIGMFRRVYDKEYRPSMKSIYWFNMPKRHAFQRSELCLTAD